MRARSPLVPLLLVLLAPLPAQDPPPVLEPLGGPPGAEFELVPWDGANGVLFGATVAADGPRVAVGAPRDGVGLDWTGSVYLFGLQADGAQPLFKLQATDGFADDHFGAALAVSGERVLVGAPHAGCGPSQGHPTGCGAAYLYEPDGQGGYAEHALLPQDLGVWDAFGISVALDGERALVGAYGDDDQGADAGAAYLFERQPDGAWLETQKLLPTSGAASDWFGWAVALDGDRAAVSSYDSDGLQGVEGSGSAHLFERAPDGTFMEVAELGAADPTPWAHFGRSLDLDGDALVVGSHRHGGSRGAAHVFRLRSGTWQETQVLRARRGRTGDSLGTTVALDAGRLLAAAPGRRQGLDPSGLVLRFDLLGTRAYRTARWTPGAGEYVTPYGFGLAWSGARALVGVPGAFEPGRVLVLPAP